jgi:hypothetical protein
VIGIHPLTESENSFPGNKRRLPYNIKRMALFHTVILLNKRCFYLSNEGQLQQKPEIPKFNLGCFYLSNEGQLQPSID